MKELFIDGVHHFIGLLRDNKTIDKKFPAMIIKTNWIFLFQRVVVFKLFNEMTSNNVSIGIEVNLQVLDIFWYLLKLFLELNDDVDLHQIQVTSPVFQELSTWSSIFSYFLGFKRLLFFDFMKFYSLIAILTIIINNTPAFIIANWYSLYVCRANFRLNKLS